MIVTDVRYGKNPSRIIKVSPNIGGYLMICILLKSPGTDKT